MRVHRAYCELNIGSYCARQGYGEERTTPLPLECGRMLMTMTIEEGGRRSWAIDAV